MIWSQLYLKVNYDISIDGSMFLNMKIYNKIDKRDYVAIDGGYTPFIKQLEKLCKKQEMK